MNGSFLQACVERAITDSFFIDRLATADFEKPLPTTLIYNRIFLIEGGSGSLIIDDNQFDLGGQELFLLSKGQVYHFDKAIAVKGYVLCFGDCFWEKAPASASNCKAVLFNNVQANQQLPVNKAETQHLLFLFTALKDEYLKTAYPNKIDALAAYLKIIMIQIANVRITAESIVDSPDYLIYRKFMDLLNAHYQTHIIKHIMRSVTMQQC